MRSEDGALRSAADLGRWLRSDALPLWAEHGVDRSAGGFFEKLRFDLAPVEEPRRARLVARQIYCFSAAAELGWEGPAAQIVRHGLDFLTTRLIEDDGTIVMSTSPDGAQAKRVYDPYDYAFVLFGLASAARGIADRGATLALATRIRDRLVAGWSHPEMGFEEASPRTLPLKSNPHMHLLEAFLAWDELVGDTDASWRAQAAGIVDLAHRRLIDPRTGALSEFFDGDWRPMPDEGGLTVEPGHQFEWSWLLARWALAENDRASFDAAVRLAEIGETHGIDPSRGVAVNALDEHLALRDGQAKLWPQTERIKAWDILSRHPFADDELKRVAAKRVPLAIAGLARFLEAPRLGLWREVMEQGGGFVEEPVRASSFYHITCAIHALHSDLSSRG